ncbi:putative glycoside hydrolase [Simiduia agarivorans]|nr:putative glycoside hydrolase [Simiduia agarivorans]
MYARTPEGRVAATTNSLSDAWISITGHDYLLQDDARRIAFTGRGKAAAQIASDMPVDFSGFVASDAALIMDLRVNQQPEGDVELGMHCLPDCAGAVSVTDAMAKKPAGQWQKFSVDMTCLVKAGLQADRVSAPFVLSSAGTLDISLANIQLMPGKASEADVRCSE